jgi:hypothetical protein
MISSAEIEEYIACEMLSLCSASYDGGDQSSVAAAAAAARLFHFDALFSEVAAALGPAKSVTPHLGEAPSSLRGSVEYLFPLHAWPDFDFVICASPAGYAWGQRFVRASHLQPLPIVQISDLGRWSHTRSEVSAELGAPIESEGWSSWESATFRLQDGAARLCFVFELLQSVTRP